MPVRILLALLLLSTSCFAQPVGGAKTWFEEADGSPSIIVYKTIVSNGTLTNPADGTGSLDTSGGGSVSDTAYAASWDGITTIAPSKNAVYDKLAGGAGDITAVGDCSSGDCFDGTSGNTFTLKGATSGTTALKPTAIAGTTTITLPAETGTACTTGSVCSGYQAGALTGDVVTSGAAATIQADSVALTTDTTGNYAAGDAEAGNALTGDSATAFFSSGTLEVAIGGTGTTTSTGTGSVVLGTSPTFTTKITSPEIENTGNITIDAINAAATSTVSILNSDGTYTANLDVEGDLIVTDITVSTGGTLQLGQDGTDGILKLYSEQGGTDYIASLYSHTAMTSAASFFLPVDEPAATSFINMTTGGVMGFVAPNAGTDITADLEEEVTEGSLADSTIVSADIKDGTIVTGDLSGTAGITLAQTAMTAGRSLTIATNDVAADAELYTDTKCIYWENPIATDDFKSIWYTPIAATITSIWAESDQTVTFMLQTDDNTPSDMDTVDLAPAAGVASDTSLDGDNTVAAGDRVDLAVTSVANTPTWASICFSGTYDD